MQTEFRYKAIDKKGKVVDGFRSASDELSLNKQLRAEGLNLISAESSKSFNFKGLWSKIKTIGTISIHDKIIVYRNIGSMIDAGLSLSRALSVIERQAKNPKLKKVIGLINKDVKKGTSLSDALAKFPKTFNPLMISMVAAGEESGNMVEALNVTSNQLEKTYNLQRKIKGAMIYPGVIISAMLLIAGFMLIYIVPTLTNTFSELNVELPGSTQFIIAFSDLLKNNLLLFLAGIVIIVVGFIFGIKTTVGKRMLDWTLLHIPGVSPLVKQINSARTARTLASLLSAGVPFVRSLEIVEEVMQNSYYKTVIKQAQKNIQLGLPISKVFSEAEHLYPVFVAEMMAVGEETGELGPMLLKVADFYEEEVDEKTKSLSTIIEPVLMIVVGAAVGFFAISMISPMYSLVENI